MRRLSRLIRLFRQDEKGNVLIIVAAALILLMGMTALAVDVGGLYGTRRQAVNAADAAALAAALERREDSATAEAVKYANENYNATLEGIVFTYPPGPGQGPSQNPGQGPGGPPSQPPGNNNDDGRITTVLVSRQFNFSFARVLGFDETNVYAMASVQRGVGNGLVPFILQGFPCYCCFPDPFTCPDCDPDGSLGECDCVCPCTDTDNNDNGCDCEGECICPEGECDCIEGECNCPEPENVECGICKQGYEDKVWKVRNEDGVCAKPGENMVLKFKHHDDGHIGPGNFHIVRFPDDQPGLPATLVNIGGGYNGPLEKLYYGEELDSIGTVGNRPAISSALESRQAMADDPPCSYETLYEKYPDDIYRCDLVVVIPLFRDAGAGAGATARFEIVGYASFLLDFSDGVDGHEVKAILLEYLTFERLLEIYGEQLVGFVYRLIEDPPEAKEQLLQLMQ